MAGVSYLGTAEVLFYRSNNLSQLRFYGNLPVEDRRTVENLREIAHENISEALRKRLGLDSLHGNNFPH